MRLFAYIFLLPVLGWAEVHSLTLKQTLDVALQQNPDLILARLEERKVAESIRLAKDPFYPKVYAGSGLAYSSGFPLSVEGSAPSIFQAKAIASVFNRPKTYALAESRENARTAGFDVAAKRDDIAYRTATLYFDVERASRSFGTVEQQLSSLEKVVGTVSARVEEGRELAIERSRVELRLAQARQRAEVLSDEREYLESTLAVVLGFSAGDQVRPTDASRPTPELPANENEAVETALQYSREMRRIESEMVAKGFALRSQKAARLPQVDLVAQYSLLSRFNNYDQFFRSFQRNNGQIGVSIQVPLIVGEASKAGAAQADIDIQEKRNEYNNTRNRITLDVRHSYQLLREAESSQKLARQDLDLQREDLSRVLALMGEGRATMKDVEQLRAQEQDKWIAFYEATNSLERARLSVLKQTGTLITALR